jgi:hypothetical protein
VVLPAPEPREQGLDLPGFQRPEASGQLGDRAADATPVQPDGARAQGAVRHSRLHQELPRGRHSSVSSLLKLGRLTETDLGDCLAALARAKADRLRFDAHRVLLALAALPAAGDSDIQRRRQRLRDAVGAAGR